MATDSLLIEERPYPNEHSCRLRDPGGFQKDSFRRTSRKHDGKEYHVVMGRLKGKTTMTEQAYRYPKGTWSASEAGSHCRAHDGQFEAASRGAEPAEELDGLVMTKAIVQPMPQDDAEMMRALEIINTRFARVSLSPDDIYIFRAEMSNQHLDAHWTRMAAETLENYLDDARRGVPLMNSHKTGGLLISPELPMGRSYWADLEGEPLEGLYPPIGEAGQRLTVDHYILRGYKGGEISADNAIRGIDGGVIKSGSIGFMTGWYQCAICGHDYRDRENCQHHVSLRYEQEDQERVCFAWVRDGHLWEDSLVWAGATPDAFIRKAQECASRLSRGELRILEENYQTRLLETNYYVIDDWKQKMGKEVQIMDNVKEMIDVGAIVREYAPEILPLLEGDETAQYLAVVAVKLQEETHRLMAEAESLQQKVKELTPRAERGDLYVKDLVEKAVAARVRVQGSDFDAGPYRDKLSADADIDYIKAEIAAHEAQMKAMFQPGRQVKPQAQKEADTQDEDRFYES